MSTLFKPEYLFIIASLSKKCNQMLKIKSYWVREGIKSFRVSGPVCEEVQLVKALQGHQQPFFAQWPCILPAFCPPLLQKKSSYKFPSVHHPISISLHLSAHRMTLFSLPLMNFNCSVILVIEKNALCLQSVGSDGGAIGCKELEDTCSLIYVKGDIILPLHLFVKNTEK